MDGFLDVTQGPPAEIDLIDWKRRIGEAYRRVRSAPDPAEVWRKWRAVRDQLFAAHPQSPLTEEARAGFSGLPYFDYEPALRVSGSIQEAKPERYEIATSGEAGGSYAFTRFALVSFIVAGRNLSLELYWLEGYGGGLFLPFRDATSGRTTYGAGRYLFDTVKGADLGGSGNELVLDFNFAYNPSCAYDPKWVCPLAPPPNRLDVAIQAGERYP